MFRTGFGLAYDRAIAREWTRKSREKGTPKPADGEFVSIVNHDTMTAFTEPRGYISVPCIGSLVPFRLLVEYLHENTLAGMYLPLIIQRRRLVASELENNVLVAW